MREGERERERVAHRHTHIYTEAARIQPLPAIHHVLHRKHFFCLLCCVTTGARAFVSSTDPASSYMFMCPYPRYRYRHPGGRRTAVPTDARGAQQEQVVGIQGFGGGESRAACTNWRRAVGRNWCRRSLRGVALGGQPSHTRCTVHGPDVSCSRLGGAVGTASGIISGLSNTGSSIEFGVPACQPLQQFRPPQGWSALHAIGVAAPEGSAGGEDARVAARRCTLDFFAFSVPGTAAMVVGRCRHCPDFFFSRSSQGDCGGPCNELTLRAMDLNKTTHTRQLSGEHGVTHIAKVHARAHDEACRTQRPSCRCLFLMHTLIPRAHIVRSRWLHDYRKRRICACRRQKKARSEAMARRANRRIRKHSEARRKGGSHRDLVQDGSDMDEGGAEYDEGGQFRDQRPRHGWWWWRVMAVGEDGPATDPTHHPCRSFPFFFFGRGPYRPPLREEGEWVVGEGGRAPVAQRPRGGTQVEDVMRRPSGGCAPRQQ